ncbi:DUF4255 domain-containing protein [Streptomyces sp. NPDC001262]|uniref:DUF4255 domain-containing protein n=1 Tax=Streptomyces TaxID=1883 RepID=UPI00368C0F58
MSVVQRVDDALKEGLGRGPLSGSRIPVTFDTPGSEWSARRSGPCVNVFLHSVEEDAQRTQTGRIGVVDEEGTVIGYRRPPRYFVLSYLVTVWAQTVADEHRLLGRLLEWCAVTEELALPQDGFGPQPDRLGLRVRATGGESSETPASRVWSSLGTPARPGLDLVVTVPLEREPIGTGPAPVHGLALRTGRLPARPEDDPAPRSARPRRRVEEVR